MTNDTERNRAQYRKDQRNRYHRRKAQALATLGGKCVACGTTANLEFDHIDPATKVAALSELMLKPDEVWLAEVSKCQLLCKKCHRHKTYQTSLASPLAHGTAGMYRRRGCRCDVCLTYSREYAKAYGQRPEVKAARNARRRKN